MSKELSEIKAAAKSVLKSIESDSKRGQWILIKRQNIGDCIPIFIVDDDFALAETLWDDFEFFKMGKDRKRAIRSYICAMMTKYYDSETSKTPLVRIIDLKIKAELQFDLPYMKKIKDKLSRENAIRHHQYFMNKQ